MDTATASLIARQIIEQAFDWKFYALMLTLFGIAGATGAYVGGYLKSRGEHLATKADFKNLLEQLQQTTQTTESIKQTLSHQDWLAREYKTLRREKLEEMMNAAYETHHWLNQRNNSTLYGVDEINSPDPSNKLMVVGCLYFPELKQELRELNNSFGEYKLWQAKANAALVGPRIEKNMQAYAAATKEALIGLEKVHPEMRMRTTNLERKAIELMEKMFAGG